MNSKLSAKEFLLGATACVKAVKSLSAESDVALAEGNAPVVRDFGNGLCAVYLVEKEDGLIYVQNHHLHGTSLTPEGLHELGLHNLSERSSNKLRMQQHGDVYAFVMDGLFEASLILVDELWDETLAHLAPNGFVAAVPSRDVLAICDSQSAGGVASLRAMVSRVFQGGDHLLTSDLYRRENREWVLYD